MAIGATLIRIVITSALPIKRPLINIAFCVMRI
jgi:hypothetical protein